MKISIPLSSFISVLIILKYVAVSSKCECIPKMEVPNTHNGYWMLCICLFICTFRSISMIKQWKSLNIFQNSVHFGQEAGRTLVCPQILQAQR